MSEDEKNGMQRPDEPAEQPGERAAKAAELGQPSGEAGPTLLMGQGGSEGVVVPAAAAEKWAGLPEDLRAPWGWGGVGIFVAVAAGGFLVISVVLGIALGVLSAAGWSVKVADLNTYPLKAVLLTVIQTLWFGLLMLFLFFFIRVRYESPFWKTIGWRALRSSTVPPAAGALLAVLGGVGLAVVVWVLNFFVKTKTKLPIEEFFQDRQSALLLMGMAVLLAPLVEETIFRGYLYPVLARSLGVAGGVVVTGMLFGLMHAPQLRGGTGQIALLVGVGIVLTWVRAKTGTVLASFLVHLSYNSFFFLGLYAATEGFKRFPPGGP